MISTPSPNFGPRRHGLPPDMVVLHHTAMLSAEAAVTRLCDPAAEVSAHYVISEQGEVHLLIDEEMRAWHAGAGAWGNVKDVNSHSIGIELANAGPLAKFPPFPDPQMQALERLLSEMLNRWTIPAERVIAHSDMAPDRKYDPGPKFDWQRLASGGLSVWSENTEDPEVDPVFFPELAARFGYSADVKPTELLSAFRLRFCSHKSGPLDNDDMALIQYLATRFPVDLTIGAP